MATRLFQTLGSEMVRRHFEESAQRTIEEGLAAGDDHNRLAKRVLRASFGPGSLFVQATQAIPGLRFTPYLALSAVAELLESRAESLWPGDRRPFIQALRVILKGAAPALMGIGDASADVLEKRIDVAVDKTVSSTQGEEAQRRAALDLVVIVLRYYGTRPFFPVERGEDGSVLYDDRGVPRVIDREFLDFADRWRRDTKVRVPKDGGKGRPNTYEEITPEAPWQVVTFAEWLELVRPGDEIGEQGLEALRREFAPTPEWEARLSPQTQEVIRVLIRSLSTLTPALSDLERQELEDLVESMYKGEPPTERMNEQLGAAFSGDIITAEGPTRGTFSRETVDRVRNAIDFCLKGEQSQVTKARKLSQAVPAVLRNVREALRDSAPWLLWGFNIWLGTLIVAAFLIVVAIFMPAGWIVTFTMICAWFGGVLAFAHTWPYPALQSLFSFLPESMSERPDWLKSLGRRIGAFAMPLGCAILPVFIWLQAPVLVKVLLVGGILATMGVYFARVEANDPLAQARVRAGISTANALFIAPLPVFALLLTLYHAVKGEILTGPVLSQWVWTEIGDVWKDHVEPIFEKKKPPTTDSANTTSQEVVDQPQPHAQASHASPITEELTSPHTVTKTELCRDPLLPREQRGILDCP